MAVTWNIDQARRTIQTQMVEANRLDAVIDELAAERDEWKAHAEAAEAQAAQYQHDLAVALETETRQARRATEAEAALEQCQQERDSLREQVAALAAEIERLHVGLSELQDGMPDYLDCAVQDLIDGAA